MPTPSMPRGLRVTTTNYSIGDPGGVKATEVAGGAPRYALQYMRGPQQFNVSIVLLPQHMAIWTVFYFHVIQKGSISFEMKLDSGFGLETHLCNIVPGSYQATRSGQLTVITFVVTAESTVYQLDAATVDMYMQVWEEQGVDLNALFDRLDQFANVDTNVLDF